MDNSQHRNRDIPPIYQRVLTEFDSTLAKQALEWFDSPDQWSLYVTGALGSGKTCFVAALLMKWRETHPDEMHDGIVYSRAPQCFFVAPYTLSREIRSLGDEDTVYDHWQKGRGLLVLDDVGALRSTPHLTERLVNLLQYRYDYQLKTIVSSNLLISQIANHVDPRTASRLQEGVMVTLGKIDRRRKR